MNNTLVRKDLINICSDLPLMEQFKNKTVLVTGSTGLIGSLIVKSLIVYNGLHNANTTIVAALRNKNKIEDVYKNFDIDNVSFVEGDISDTYSDYIKNKVDIIIHTAAVTTSKIMVDYPVETIDSLVLGTKQMLEFAKNYNAKMLYVSSMEGYGKMNKQDKVKEGEMGYLNPAEVRSNYPLRLREVKELGKNHKAI